MKKSKYQQCFHCFIVYILVHIHFGLVFSRNIVSTLISVVFRAAALIRGEVLIRGKRLIQWRYPKVRRLLEEIQYLKRRFGRICVRIWLNSFATNFNIISKEYGNIKRSFLALYFWRWMMSSYKPLNHPPLPTDKLI